MASHKLLIGVQQFISVLHNFFWIPGPERPLLYHAIQKIRGHPNQDIAVLPDFSPDHQILARLLRLLPTTIFILKSFEFFSTCLLHEMTKPLSFVKRGMMQSDAKERRKTAKMN